MGNYIYVRTDENNASEFNRQLTASGFIGVAEDTALISIVMYLLFLWSKKFLRGYLMLQPVETFYPWRTLKIYFYEKEIMYLCS